MSSGRYNILVTGGAGFIGSHIVEALLLRGDNVRVLDNFATGKRENLAGFGKDIELIEGDIRSYHIVHESARGVDVILHQAALPSVPRSIADPITTHEVNATGTLNLLNAARDLGVRRIVFASSSSIYGDGHASPKHEDMNPNPLSPYAVSKLAGEKYMQIFHRLYGIEAVSLRYFNVFGPRQDPNSQYSAVIPKFITGMLAGISPVIFGDGEQSRDFTFIENVVGANMLASTAEAVGGSVMNIACGRSVTLNRLCELINASSGQTIRPRHEVDRPGDVRHSLAAIETAATVIGYVPRIDFETGLERTITYYRDRA